MVGCPGLEPGTCRLKAEYSTIELATPPSLNDYKRRFDKIKHLNFLSIVLSRQIVAKDDKI